MLPKRILIANRGEIASRIQSSASRLGIETLSVFHAEDRNAPFVVDANSAFELHSTSAGTAYLDIEQILDIAQAQNADAIHPGYGFLAENPEFARATNDRGMCFIGPSWQVMELMADKLRSRQFAKDAGLAVAPCLVFEEDQASFLDAAVELGFPLIIKAAAGGGGKGMRRVENASELAEKLASASREANRHFGDGRIYVEPYVEAARHIEVQVLGDGQGKALHLGERDCSIQRNYQKLIEESPAANLERGIRASLLQSAVKLAQASNYEGAGTVEFLLTPSGEYFFLEMNTRLQVEHPVTECITGLDLVELQIRIADEKQLPISQEDVRFDGHAIEMRICAEDPEEGFLPSTGRLLRQIVPQARGIRYDTGVCEGQVIGSSFDSMLAKLIASGENRSIAINRAVEALRDLTLLGVTSNQDFLARVVAHPMFIDGHMNTAFLSRHAADLKAPELTRGEADQVFIAAFLGGRDSRRLFEMTSGRQQ